MKLVQLNIWGGRLGRQFINFLEDEQPGIVCLQEVVDAPGDGLMSTTLDQLAKESSLEHTFFSPVFSFNLMNKKAGFGNAILSDFAFSKQDTIFTGLEHKDDFDFDDDNGNIRNLQHAVIEMDNKKINILNHHGHHINQHKNGDTETMRQCKMIADYIKTIEGPIILTGDFNLSPHSESLEQLNKVLTNLSIEYKLKTTRNQFTHKVEVCDYIFTSEGIKVNNFFVSDELMSDHGALVLDFDLK